MLERFTSGSREVVVAAVDKATSRGDKQIRPAHLLFGLVKGDGAAPRVLADLGITEESAEAALGPAGTAPAPSDADALQSIGIDLDEIRRRAEEHFGAGALERDVITRRAPFSWASNGKRFTGETQYVLETALREARAMQQPSIGAEHVLLGLLRLGRWNRFGDFTPAMLAKIRLDPDAARERLLTELRLLTQFRQ